ncbi:MAG: NOL1/NOP2/sun family putative RNA methylase [Candidatus Nanohaloarchaeota archaeon]|nr:NOL1/NOP2/sun family putative RNA methylase [Candidatus Nanohaloarchaeota archaeon]
MLWQNILQRTCTYKKSGECNIAHNIIIPKDFKARYSKILGKENKVFLNYCIKPLRKSIRINTIKYPDPEHLAKQLEEQYGWNLKQIPWFKDAYWIQNPDVKEGIVGNTFEHFMGYYYVQEASSLIPPVVLDPKPTENILDMAAAPGSKTTQICQMMHNKGSIVANDINIERIKALRFNIEKLGCLNIATIRSNGITLSKTNLTFDKILLDAPCSSEGTVRKNWKVLSRWSTSYIKQMSKEQKKLILSAYDMLKPGGVLVYSTCTLAPEENEEVIDHLLKHREDAKVMPVKVKGLKIRPGIEEWEGKTYNAEVKKIARIWPQDNDSEGFVVAKIMKST